MHVLVSGSDKWYLNIVCKLLVVQLNDLLAMPSKKGAITAGKILQTIGVTVAGVAIISGLYLSSKK